MIRCKITCVVAMAVLIAWSQAPPPAGAADGNLGSTARQAASDPVVAVPASGGPRVLYVPSDVDDPVFRADIAAELGPDAVVDYFDPRTVTPDAELLGSYDCVMTWVDYPYADAALFGDRLADFVDGGGSVVLGPFCAYTIGNHLEGRIMSDAAYCPVTGGLNHWSYSTWDGSCASDCLLAGVSNLGATYRDILTLRSGSSCGQYADGEILVAYNESRSVIYANGGGGLPLDGNGPFWPKLIAGACSCDSPVANDANSWGAVKALYR